MYNVAYYQIAGYPLILYLGLVTLLCLITTVSIVTLNKRGYHAIPMKWHFLCGKITVVLGILHGCLGALVYIG